MSLLGSDDFTSSFGRSLELKPTQKLAEEHTTTPSDSKGRVKSGDFTLDSQKFSSFSLRRRKDKDSSGGDAKGQKRGMKSSVRMQPPDSPKAKTGPSPVSKSSRKQQYAHLLENEASSEEEEEEDDTQSSIVLSRGHQAREKRGSIKSPNGDKSMSFDTFVTNPTAIDNTFGASPVRTSPPNPTPTVPSFPVSFSPPHKSNQSLGEFSLLPESIAPIDMEFTLTLDDHCLSDPIPVIPPPPASHQPQLPFPTAAPQFQTTPTSDDAEWEVSEQLYEKCISQFNELGPTGGLLSGEKSRDFFLKSNLPLNELSQIWKLSDIDRDGSLSLEEFVIAMKLVLMRRRNFDIPQLLPQSLKVPPSQGIPSSSGVPSFNFPPPPPPAPIKRQAPTVPSAARNPVTESDMSPPPIIPALPAFLVNSGKSKTEPIIAISDVQTSDVEHVTVDDTPPPAPAITSVEAVKPSIPEEKEVGMADFMLNTSLLSEGDAPLLPQEATTPVSIVSPVREPAVSRLISLANEGEESTGDEDDTLVLVSSGEHPPIPKPRKKKRTQPGDGKSSELHRSHTVHARMVHPPPPRPAPYKQRSSTSPPSSEQLGDTSLVSSTSPVGDNDLAPIIPGGISKPPMPPKPSLPPKPDLEKRKRGSSSGGYGEDLTDGFNLTLLRDRIPSLKKAGRQVETEKGHGRSTSWDLTKMLRDEGELRLHEDLPSAEPPKPPPRHKKERSGYHTDEDDDEGRRPNKLATPLQRSASTGSLASLASTGAPTPLISKSRTSSAESGAILDNVSESKDTVITRSDTLVSRRPAPAPPPNKPKKPIYPPSFKKVKVDTSPDRLSGDNVTLLGEGSSSSSTTTEVYQKKSKSELQRSIKRLKEENNMYNSLNSELSKKLNELRLERHRLEGQLNQRRTVTSH